jgi:C1A family cysteine protease
MGNSISTENGVIPSTNESDYHPMAKNRVFKYKRDHHNHLFQYCSFTVPKDGEVVPTKVDLSPDMPPVYDQGQLGSCTANACNANFQFQAMKQKEPDQLVPSRLFEYYNSRITQIPASPNEDSGASLSVSIECLNKFGVCDEKDYPYVIADFTKKPPGDLYDKAKYHKCFESKRIIPNHDQMKGCLREGFPFVMGVAVYSSFMTLEAGKTGIIPDPKTVDVGKVKAETLLGGHAILCVGYDDETKHYKFRNSWSDKWGDKGYGYLSYEFLTNDNLAYDMWSVRLVKSPIDPVEPITKEVNEEDKKEEENKEKK